MSSWSSNALKGINHFTLYFPRLRFPNAKEGMGALENAEISSELPLEEVKCDYTVSDSDFTAKICFCT